MLGLWHYSRLGLVILHYDGGVAAQSVITTDSTFYGDLFPHVISWHGELYLEDGLHRALRAALQQRSVLHVRVLELD